MVKQQTFWQRLFKRQATVSAEAAPAPASKVTEIDFDFPRNDPLVAYFRELPGVVDITTLTNRQYCVILDPVDASGSFDYLLLDSSNS